MLCGSLNKVKEALPVSLVKENHHCLRSEHDLHPPLSHLGMLHSWLLLIC